MAVEAHVFLAHAKGETYQLLQVQDGDLGLAVDSVPYSQAALDRLWHIAHMPEGKLIQDTNLQPDVERARRVRALFSGGE